MGRLHKGLGGHAGCVMQTPNERYNNLSLTFHSSINPWCKMSSYDSTPNSMPGFVGDTDALGLLDMGVCPCVFYSFPNRRCFTAFPSPRNYFVVRVVVIVS